jgi:hypothetical protein
MLKALIDFLLNRKGHPAQKDTTLDAAAPYKVEAPTPAPEPKVEVVSDGGTWPFPTAGAPEEKPVKPAVKAKSVRAKKKDTTAEDGLIIATDAKSTRAKKAPVAAITAAEKPARKPRAKKTQE